MKKIFNAPRVEVVKIGNDLIVTSPNVGWSNEGQSGDNALAPSRYGRGRYDAEYDIY